MRRHTSSAPHAALVFISWLKPERLNDHAQIRAAIAAAGVLVDYAVNNVRSQLPHLTRIRPYSVSGFMVLAAAAAMLSPSRLISQMRQRSKRWCRTLCLNTVRWTL